MCNFQSKYNLNQHILRSRYNHLDKDYRGAILEARRSVVWLYCFRYL